MAIFFALNGLSISFPAIFSTVLCFCWSYTTTAIDVFVAVKTFSIRSHFFPFHCKSKWKEKWIGKVPNSQLHPIIAQQVPLFDVVQSLMNFNRIHIPDICHNFRTKCLIWHYYNPYKGKTLKRAKPGQRGHLGQLIYCMFIYIYFQKRY